MTTLLRHRQVGITRVSPHPGNKRYAIPGGERGRVLGYPDDATYYDGVGNYINRTTALITGAASPVMTLSFWLRVGGGGGTDRDLFSHQFRQRLRVNSGDLLNVIYSNVALDDVATINVPTIGEETGTFHHVLISIDLSVPEGKVYVDDNLAPGVVTGLVISSIDWLRPSVHIASTTNAGELFTGCIGEFYLNIERYFDIDVEDNRRLFITDSKFPVDLGANGEIPSGAAPMIYLKNGGRDGINLGTGGDFNNVVGTPVKCKIPGPQ